jgi:ubiquinone/menaquinone biosynthesis C-methylase UbiE
VRTTSSVRDYYDLTRKAFDVLAPFYDIVTLPLVSVRWQVARDAGLPRGATILDVATGTGQQAFAFARHGYAVTAVDLTDSMLRVARHRNRNGLVRFELADATQLRFQDETFDATSVSFALHDMPPPIRRQVLKEMVRVTRENGRIVVVDYALPRNRIGRWLTYRLISLYEAEYYREFISSDLPGTLNSSGIHIEEEYPILLGAGKVWKGLKSSP